MVVGGEGGGCGREAEAALSKYLKRSQEEEKCDLLSVVTRTELVTMVYTI